VSETSLDTVIKKTSQQLINKSILNIESDCTLHSERWRQHWTFVSKCL